MYHDLRMCFNSYAMLIGPLGYSVLLWLINIHIFTIQTIQHHLHESRQSRFNCNFDEKFEDIEWKDDGDIVIQAHWESLKTGASATTVSQSHTTGNFSESNNGAEVFPTNNQNPLK